MAQDGQQALDIVVKVKPDLILLDVRMLQMNSFADCMTNLPLLLHERDSFGPAVSPARRVRSPPKILGLLPSNYLLSPVSRFPFLEKSAGFSALNPQYLFRILLKFVGHGTDLINII